jgi:hypothetical protein
VSHQEGLELEACVPGFLTCSSVGLGLETTSADCLSFSIQDTGALMRRLVYRLACLSLVSAPGDDRDAGLCVVGRIKVAQKALGSYWLSGSGASGFTTTL